VAPLAIAPVAGAVDLAGRVRGEVGVVAEAAAAKRHPYRRFPRRSVAHT